MIKANNTFWVSLSALLFLSSFWSGTGIAAFPAQGQLSTADQTGPSTATPQNSSVHAALTQPEQWDGAWISASPGQLGFDADLLSDAVKNIGRMKGIYSVIVARNRFLATEQYFREGSRTKPHNLKSSTKSVMSALIGIAIKKNLLRLDQPISDFLPFINELPDKRKKDLTIRHLLTHTAGFCYGWDVFKGLHWKDTMGAF